MEASNYQHTSELNTGSNPIQKAFVNGLDNETECTLIKFPEDKILQLVADTLEGHATLQRQVGEMGWQEPNEVIAHGKLSPALMEEKHYAPIYAGDGSAGKQLFRNG